MEQRLKRERSRLFRRVALILLAVWLLVSAIYCAIRLQNEKITVQNRELENLSDIQHRISSEAHTESELNSVFLTGTRLLYNEKDGASKDWDSQFIIIDRKDNTVIADTARKIGVRYSLRYGAESFFEEYGFIDYDTIRGAMTDADFNAIAALLNTERSDGKSCQLVCTKFHLENVEFVPVEVRVVLTEGSDTWAVSDTVIATYALNKNLDPALEVWESTQMHRNLIPKDFLLNGAYNKDYIGTLSDEQRRSPVGFYQTGLLEYLFYASDYLLITEAHYEDFQIRSQELTYLIEYAKPVSLLENCKNDLIAGTAILFGFFLVIALILCLMIWQILRSEMIQEQKRTDLTNALAHDIKTPLFVISGNAYSLKENIDEDGRDACLDAIIGQTDKINDLVHNMLNLSKLDSCAVTLNRSAFDLLALVGEILESFALLPDGKRITLTHSGDNTVRADRELMRTAIQNLVDNAVKYSPTDSEIQIDVSKNAFCISNRSEPLGKAELKQIWQPYFRKDKSRRQKGNGLGLSIVKSILDLHGAKYAADWRDGVMTVSIFRI